MNIVKIKDANLVEQVTGKEKIPVSDGSGLPKSVTVEQIREGKQDTIEDLEEIREGSKRKIPSKVSELENDSEFVTSEELDKKLEDYEPSNNDMLSIDMSDKGELVLTYGESSDFVDGSIRENGELVLEFNIE